MYFEFVYKESATLANRLIEGQVLNAQYAEESYQIKRESCTLKKQLEEKNNQNTDKTMSQNTNQNPSESSLVSNDHELETLREVVHRLSTVRYFCVFYFLRQYFFINL